MDRIAKALAEHDEVYADLNRVLFGDGADELISKLSAEEKKFQRRQAQIALGTNAVGLAAGVAGTRDAAQQFRAVKRTATGTKLVPKAIKVSRNTKLLAGAALGLQVGNVAGDAIANRVLARSAKKKPEERIKKNGPDMADLSLPGSKTAKAKFVARKIDQKTPAIKAKASEGGKKLQLKLKDEKNAILKSEELDVTWRGEISKIDEDQHLVFGYASVVEVNGEPVVDRQGDYISIEEIEKSAYDYVQKSRKGGDMHRRNGDEPHHVSDMVESFVITKEKIEKMGLPPETPLGWWVGFHVNDEDTWQEVKKGNRTGFSVHGRGNRVSKVMA